MNSLINELPATTIDPYKLSEQGVRLAGDMPVSELKRAKDLLVSDEGSVSAILDFGRDDENRRAIRGQLSAHVRVTCQRCLEPMDEHVESRFELAIVSDDEGARQVPSHYEPVETGTGGGMKVRELIEDEFLLAMAPFPMHAEADCPVNLAELEEEESAADITENRRKPFELLEGLLDKKKDDPSRH